MKILIKVLPIQESEKSEGSEEVHTPASHRQERRKSPFPNKHVIMMNGEKDEKKK